MFVAVLLLILLSCAVLWHWAGYSVTLVPSVDGTRDLRGADFDSDCFDLFGAVEFIPNALLTPEEFELRHEEIIIGSPEKEASYSTSRIRVYLPEGAYGLMLWNAEFATNIFINGHLMESVGRPGRTAELSTTDIRLLFYTVVAPDGVLEIVQQASTHVVPDGESHAYMVIGRPEIVREIYGKHKTLSAVLMGCFFALALAHLALYSLLRVYKANLWSALFCLVWFIRIGYTSPWILSSFLPLPGIVNLRLSMLTIPVSVLLFCLTFHAFFPDRLKKWFRVSVYSFCGFFVCICLFTDTVFMFNTFPILYSGIFLVVVYVITRLLMNLRVLTVEETALLAGIIVFLFGVLWDIYNSYVSPVLLQATSAMNMLTYVSMAEYALLIFVFFQIAAMFHGTMREIATAKESEKRLIFENSSLTREVKVREKIILRRAGSVPETLTKGALKLIFPSGQAFVNNCDMMLAQKEFNLLSLFTQNEGKTMASEYLYEKVWGQPIKGDTNAVKVMVSRLRKKLEGSGYTITSEYGAGYRFERG
jgi:hypothetical protein